MYILPTFEEFCAAQKVAENERIEKFYYIWQLARFLKAHDKQMSGPELAEHLNRNGIKTGYGAQFQGGRGTYQLIKAVYNWLANDLGYKDDAEIVAYAYPTSDDTYAFES